ncbi:serine hydrolase [Elongatibacter sediminis]|uniref:Serine hydrolase n=1 Tax=Elongatibacter sediminis TaxID=3119006 RepID=A0AAW9RF39_9GAMM
MHAMSKRSNLILLTAAITGCAAVHADDEPIGNTALHAHPTMAGTLEVMDAWLEGVQRYEQVPGMSVGLVRGDDLVWNRGYGVSNRESGRPADASTLYSICSISKLFTSIAVMQLRDAERLTLRDPVSEHLDWFDIEQSHSEGGPITVRSLLTHSSGLPRESDFPYWVGPEFPFPTRDAVMDRLRDQHTLYPADTVFQYSNLALTLAGEVVATLTGEPFADYVQARILEPLGLDDTRPYYPEELRGEALAIGYSGMDRSGERSEVPPFFTRGITPAAGFTSSVSDLAKFASWQFALLDRAAAEPAASVLDPNTLREMHRVHWVNPDWKTTWGLGFRVERVDDMTVVEHGGACPGYITHFAMVPKDRIAAIALTNAGDGPAKNVAHNLLKTYRIALGKARSPTEETPPDFSAFEGNYEVYPWGGEIAVRQRGGHLVLVNLPTDDLNGALTRLKHVADNRFVRLTDDDEEREPWEFEFDDKGPAARIRVHSIYWSRIP